MQKNKIVHKESCNHSNQEREIQACYTLFLFLCLQMFTLLVVSLWVFPKPFLLHVIACYLWLWVWDLIDASNACGFAAISCFHHQNSNNLFSAIWVGFNLKMEVIFMVLIILSTLVNSYSLWSSFFILLNHVNKFSICSETFSVTFTQGVSWWVSRGVIITAWIDASAEPQPPMNDSAETNHVDLIEYDQSKEEEVTNEEESLRNNEHLEQPHEQERES